VALDSKTEKVTTLSPDRGTLTNKWVTYLLWYGYFNGMLAWLFRLGIKLLYCV